MSWNSRVKSAFGAVSLPSTGSRRALLTFDDGPTGDGTAAALDVLKQHRVRAIFFVIGSRIPRAPEMLQRILDDGHVLGNHSFSHARRDMTGLRAYKNDLSRCQEAIQQVTGTVPVLFRPPLGELTLEAVLVPRTLGLRSVFWSVDSDDWRVRSGEDEAACAKRVQRALSSRHLNEIVLLHDERPSTARVLREVLPPLVDAGVDFQSGVQALLRT